MQSFSKIEILMKATASLLLFYLSILPAFSQYFQRQLADSAFLLTKEEVTYDPSYFSIDYPGGDVPADRGVCTDVIIRAYRYFEIDLQKLLHEDMKENFDLYPDRWGLNKPDKNIDHRRVPNLMKFFSRHGNTKKISDKAEDYAPGDIVCWDLGNGTPHIGIVSSVRTQDSSRYYIIHNIGRGQELSDCLFDFRITGHYVFKLGLQE